MCEIVDCPRCGGSGFFGYGTGYDAVCDECGGQGGFPGEQGGDACAPCPDCKGCGWFDCEDERRSGVCPRCDGSGRATIAKAEGGA